MLKFFVGAFIGWVISGCVVMGTVVDKCSTQGTYYATPWTQISCEVIEF